MLTASFSNPKKEQNFSFSFFAPPKKEPKKGGSFEGVFASLRCTKPK
jgi:hypothetical protein